MNGRNHRWVCMGLVLAVTAGCGSSDDSGEHILNVVRGVIRINGKSPLEGTIVTLHPKESGQSSEKIYGLYNAEDDYYGILTERDGEKLAGASEGEYVVTVQPPRNKPNSIPAKYGNPATSGLTLQVKSGVNAAPEINLVP